MERKYIFFDIDGTLTDANPGGKILESTYRTLDQLKPTGILLLLLQEEHSIWLWMQLRKHILIV